MNRVVDVQTPPVSLTLNHLPFQGRQGRFAPWTDVLILELQNPKYLFHKKYLSIFGVFCVSPVDKKKGKQYNKLVLRNNTIL